MCITFSFVEVAAHHTMNISAALSASGKVNASANKISAEQLFIQFPSIHVGICVGTDFFKELQ